MNTPFYLRTLFFVFGLAILTGCGEVNDPVIAEPVTDITANLPEPTPRQEANPQRNAYWGDLHIHSSYSYDAYTMGVRTLPDDAYTFAQGGTIQHGIGYPIRLSRPLDFAAVTDHAEYLGVPRYLDGLSPEERGESYDQGLRSALEMGTFGFLKHYLTEVVMKMTSNEKRHETFGGEGMEVVSQTTWDKIVESTQANNQPGVFTTFIAYEWTSMPDAENLHRNVIYKGDKFPKFPWSSLNSENPEDLWEELDRQNKEGMTVMSIPHNGNASNGKMYDRAMYEGGKFNREYADLRMRIEPLSEMFQVKGQSETHPLLSDEDQFADFSIMDSIMSFDGAKSQPRGSYIRDALRAGLEFSHSEGFNPYRFGVIGSSDSHNASSSVEEDNFHGKLPLLDGTAGIRLGQYSETIADKAPATKWSAAGLAAVWAEENTRASIFEAMQRKETYATTGPRISIRFFAGQSYPTDMLDKHDLLELAYAGGVPMGGQLMAGEASPVFAVWASKDSQGANLDRLQIIKGWVDESGNSHEKIFDVAASGERLEKAKGAAIASVGNTVDIKSATYSNSIGDSQLAALWRDPEFASQQEAFYYVRVLEIPTPRWSTYDAAKLGVEAPEPATIQERAVTSAIWLSPAQTLQ